MPLSASDVEDWKLISDAEVGGKTWGSVTLTESSEIVSLAGEETGNGTSNQEGKVYTLVIEGELHDLSVDLAPKRTWWQRRALQKEKEKQEKLRIESIAQGRDDFDDNVKEEPQSVSGYCTAISPVLEPALNLTEFKYFALKVRTCGRADLKWLFHVYPGSRIATGDIWSALLPPPTQVDLRSSKELYLPMDDLVQMRNGFPKMYQSTLLSHCIQNFGFGVTGPPGPFRLELQYIEARTEKYQREVLQREGRDLPPLLYWEEEADRLAAEAKMAELGEAERSFSRRVNDRADWKAQEQGRSEAEGRDAEAAKADQKADQ